MTFPFTLIYQFCQFNCYCGLYCDVSFQFVFVVSLLANERRKLDIFRYRIWDFPCNFIHICIVYVDVCFSSHFVSLHGRMDKVL